MKVMQDNRDDLYMNLRDAGIGEDVIGTQQDFKNFVTDEKNTRDLYKNLRDAGIGEDIIGTEDDFYNFISPDFQGTSTKDESSEDITAAKEGAMIGGNIVQNADEPTRKSNVGIAAQQVVDEYDRSVAENGNNTPLSTPQQERQPVQSQTQERTSKAQFVPEYANVKGFTVAKDSPLRQQYPFLDQLGEDEQAYFRTDTNEPLYAWKDSEDKDITPDEAATLNQRADIEQNDAIRPRQVPVTSLQLPEEVKSSGIRTDKKMTEYIDGRLKEQYGDDYLDRQITLNDGTTVSGDEMLGKVSQQVYDNLNKQINEARVTYVSADNAGRKRIINQFVNNYKGLLSEATVKRALEEHDALQEATAESKRRERAEWAQMKEDNPGFWQTLKNSIGAGFVNFGAGLLDTMQELSSGLIVEDPSKPGGYMRTRSYEESLADKNDPLTIATNMLHGKAERLSKSAQPYKGKKGFLDMLWDGEITEFLQKGVATAGESLPMTLSAFNPYTMAINAISMAGSNFRQNTLDNPNIPAWKRAMQAIGSAAIEQAVEKYSDPIFKYVGGNKVLRGVSKENSEKIVTDVTEEAVNTLSGRIFNRLKGLTKDAAGEGVEEVMTDAGNDLLGETLDLVSGSTDYGLRAQWEEFKEDNPNANLKTFAKNKAKEYVEDFIGGAMAGAYTSSTTQLSAKALQYSFDKIGGAQNQVDPTRLNPVQVDIAQSYDDGYNAESGEVAEMTDNYNRQRLKVESTFSPETVTEIDNDPISLLDSGSINGEDMQTVIDYVNAKARYDGIMQRNSDDAETGVDHRNLHSDGMIHAAMLYPSAESGEQPQEVFIIKGDIVADANGKVDVEKSSDMITYRGADGQVHITSPNKFQSVAQPISVEEYAAANAPQQAQSGYAPGQQISVNIDGQDMEGEVTNVGEDGNVLVSFENPDGTLSSRWFAPEELQQSNGRIAEGQEEIQNEQTPITDEYSRFVDSGTVSDDTVSRIADKIASGQQLTPEEESMRQGAVERVENLLKEKQTGQNGQNVQTEQPPQEAAQQTAQTEHASQPQQTEESGQGQTALSRIPVDEKGKPAYDKAEPDLAWDAIMEKTDGDEEIAKNVVDAMVKQQEAEVDKLKKKQPKAIPGDVDSMIAAQKEKKAAIAAAEERLEQWRKIADTPNRRAAAANVQPIQNPSDETSTQPVAAIAPTENTGNVEPTDTGNAQTTEQGTEVPAGVQGTVEDGAVSEETSAGEEPNIERGRQGNTVDIAGRQQDNLGTSEEINAPLSPTEQDEYGKPLVLAEDGTTVFGVIDSQSGLTEAPIKLSLGENRIDEDGRNHGYGLLHIEAGHGEQIRNAGYKSVEQFVEDVAKNYTDIKEGALIGKNQTYLVEVSDEHNNTLFIQLSNDGTYWNVNSAGIFKKKYSRRKPIIYTVPAVGESVDTDTSEVNSGQSEGATAPAGNSSIDKDTQTSANEQTVGEKIAEEEAKVEQNPTDGQKEAGNYKKGHIKIDGYDVTIENPKGSVRSGVDRNGQEWSVTMNNTYGYIRGTEGVDGDHIDVFLSDDPTQGDVYVIDQVNEDGSFDEHKVMYGFKSALAAKRAYLANYSPDWNGLGTITKVSKEEFKKWINSSHRKTKPFAEYKSVNKDGAQNEGNTLANEAHELFSDIIAQSTHSVEINDNGVSETDNTLYAPIKVDGKDTNLSLFQEEPAHSNEEPIVGISFYRDGMTYQEAADLSDEYNKYVGERVCADGSDELSINFSSIDEAVRFEEWLNARRLGEDKPKNKRQKQNRKVGKNLPFTETEYANMRMKELMKDNPQLDEDDAENQALDEYPSYIGEKIKSGELENLYAELPINGKIKLSHIVESAGFDVSDISGKANEERQEGKRRNSHNVGEHITIEFNDGTLVTGEIIKAEDGKITVLSDDNKRKYTVPEKNIIKTNNNDGGVRYREADNEISDFAQKHNLNEKDVQDYVDYMRQGNLNGASGAFTDIRRKVRIDNRGVSLGEFAKIFSPIRKELYEKFGNVDDLREQYVQAEMEKRNMMEAARKRAEEAAEAERRRLQVFQDMTDEQLDEEYSKAVEANDENRMRDLVNEAARRNGYGDVGSEYQGVGAWSAPSNPGYESDEKRRAAVENDAPDVNITDIANGYSQQPSDYFTNLRAYGTDTPHGRESAEAINKAIDEVKKGKDPMVKVYRAVPKTVKEGKLRNGDWVTPSRKYAEMHGDNRLEGDYRIIEQEVPASQLWWDGNDINEWGFDDGKGYAYRNTKNNRKLNDLITRDDNGNIIPLSQRFNARKADVRYRNTESQAVTDNEIEEANRYFNNELDAFKAKTHKGLLHLGQPGRILNACGINTELTLSPTVLSRKLKQHGLNVDDIKGLAGAIQEPILVYQHGDVHPNTAIVTDLTAKGGKVSVAVELDGEGNVVELNNVSSIHSKDATTELERLSNMRDGYLEQALRWVDKNKVSDWLGIADLNSPIHANNPKLVSVANILQNFENPNVLEENLAPTEQTNDIDTAVADTAGKLNIGVRVAHSVDEVGDEGVRRAIEKGRNVKGWYDTRTDEIVVYAPNTTDADDAVRTVLHEGVAHYGLRQLMGEENFDTFLDNIYNNVDGEIKAAIDEKAQRNGWSTRVATEEYLASLAEDTNFEEARSNGLWQKIKDFFTDLLTKAGVRLNEALTDNELRYLLWRSYENLAEPNGRGTIGTVRDVAMQGRLGVGNYEDTDARLRETEDEQTPERKSENKYRELYDKRVSRRRARLNRSYFDSMQPVKVLQQTITEETGQQIRPEENVYLQENRANSMAQRKHEMWERGHMEPARREVTKLMQQIMGGNWLTRRFKLPKTRRNAYNAVVRYMKSKHGLENNEYRRNMEAEAAREPFEAEIGAVEAQVKDGKVSRAEADKRQKELKEQADKAETESRAKTLNKDYSGLQGIYGKDFERKAKEYVKDFEDAYDTKPLWREWNGATKAILEEEYKSGLLSKELYDRIRKMYKYYIPLKGWAENRAEDVYTYYATGSGDGGRPHRREGRTSESDDPLVTLEQDADRQFTAAARNRTKQALYNLATAHKSSLLTVRRQWYQNMGTKENPDWQRKDPEIPENATPEQMEQIIKDFEKDMRKLEKEGTAMRQKKPMILPYHATKSMEKEHTVRVMVNGKEYVIYVNGNPAAAQAVNGTSTPQDPDGSVLKRIYGALRWINRVKASLLTAVNVNFIPSNLVRDAQYSIQNMKAKEPVGYVLKYVKNLGEGMAKMTSARLFYKDKKGTLDMNDKTERLFKEFLDNGGETGYTARYTLEKQRRRNMEAINRMTGVDWWAGLRMLQHSLEYVNRSVETIVRFAAYKTSREVGRSIVQSINDAKEASVNFDKHGSGELGNKEWRLAYIFSNVGFQALRRLLENASGHKVRFTLAQIERFALGFAVPMIAKSLLDSDGDDDEKDAYEALPEWMRESGLAVPVSPILRKVGADDAAEKVKRVFLYLPLGPEDKIWYALGENAWHLFNKGEMTEEEAMDMAVKFGSLAADLLPLDFQGYGGDPIVSLAPTPVQDFVALRENVNYWGQPIYRESTNYNEHDPGHRLAFTGTPEWYVERAEDINRLTGGDEYTKGWLSPKPEQIEYFINQTGGGVTRVVNQVMSLIERAGEDGNKDIQVLKNVPVVSSLAKKADVQDGKEGFDREKYYDYIDEYEKALHDYNAYRKAKRNGDEEAGQKAEELKESPTGERMDIIRKDIRKIRNKDKQVRRIDEKENPTAEEEARRDRLKTESNELKQKLLEKLDKEKEKPDKQ